jgi:hypothetical protein
MFCNESGIYCLRPTQSIDYVGRYMERNWIEEVDRANLGIVQATHFGVQRLYKVSVPILADETDLPYIENSEVYVYDHTMEGLGSFSSSGGGSLSTTRLGAWSRYDDHQSIGWCNLSQDAYFASSTGRVFSIRRQGDETDYRDDSGPVDFMIDTRANDAGNAGIRKILDAAIIHYRTGGITSTSTQVLYSVDLEQEYTATSPVVIRPTASPGDDMSDAVGQDIVSIRHNLQRRRGAYFAIQVLNAGMDEDIEIAGIEYKIGGLTEKGFTQAAQTK